LLRNGQEPPVATAMISCESHVNGECTPSPAEALMEVDGQAVIVQLTVLWKADPVSSLERKIRGISFGFQSMRLASSMSARVLAAAKQSEALQFQLTRNGRKYTAPAVLNATDKQAVTLSSNVTFELGPCFLDAWRTHFGADALGGQDMEVPARLQELVVPTVELLIGGQAVGLAELPEVSWDRAGSISKTHFDTDIYDTGEDQQLQKFGIIPVSSSMRDTSSQQSFGVAGLDIAVGDAGLVSWIYPDEVTQLPEDSKASLSWTAGATPSQEVQFLLRASYLDDHGHFADYELTNKLQLRCTSQKVETKNKYHGYDYPCAFNTTLELSHNLRRHIVFSVRWAAAGREHIMPSDPVNFISAKSRRLWSTEQARQMQAQSWALGPLHVQTSEVDFNAKMKEINPRCGNSELHYSITVGTLVRAKVIAHSFAKSMDSFVSNSASESNYDSGWKPLAGSGLAMETFAGAGLLPKAACQGGACSGQLPSCLPGAMPVMQVPHLQFELSRSFRWTSHSSAGVRRIIAFGLGIIPEALDILVAHHSDSAHRRLGSGTAVTRRFAARFKEPLGYRLDLPLAQSLFHAGAWRGLKDGREAELGEVVIRLVAVASPSSAGSAFSTPSRSLVGLAVGLASCMAVALAVVLLRTWHLRKRRVIDIVEYDEVPFTAPE